MGSKSKRRAYAALLLAVCVVAGSTSGAQTAPGGAGAAGNAPPQQQALPSPVISAQADRLLRESSDYLKAAAQLSFHADITYDDLLPTGQKIQLAASYDVAVRRPDRFYTE
jgi:hypothetical protein